MSKISIEFQGYKKTENSYLIIKQENDETFVLKGSDAEEKFERILKVLEDIENEREA